MLFVWFAAIHFAAVIAWEAQRRRTMPWLDEEWAPRLLVSTAFVSLLIPAIGLVAYATIGEAWEPDWGAGLAIWVAVAAVFAYYTRVREDLFMLTAAGGSVMAVLTFLAGRIIFRELDLELFGGLLMSALLIAEVVLGVAWLRYMIRRPSAPELEVIK
jgi:cell division protein FtsW (lipid II flippase)